MAHMEIPPPESCHDFYKQSQWIRDYLDTKEVQSSAICVAERNRSVVSILDDSYHDPYHIFTVAIKTAWGIAPYVGRPFVYTWNYITDHEGRSAAGKAHIHYV
jgi:hypothetical protein